MALLLFVLFWAAPSLADAALILEGPGHPYGLAGHYARLDDPTGRLSFDDVRVQQFAPQPGGVNLGYSDSTYWFRVELVNRASPEVVWLLVIDMPYPDHVVFYQDIDGRRVESAKGRRQSLTSTQYPHRHSIFPIEFDQSGRATVHLRVDSLDVIALNASIAAKRDFIRGDRDAQLLFGGYFGIMLAMVVYNLFLFMSLRDRLNLYYVFFIFSVACNAAIHFDFAHEYLVLGGAWLDPRINILAFNLTIVASILFMSEFLSLPSRLPRLHVALRFFLVAALVNIGIALVSPAPSSLVTQLLLVPLVVTIFIAGVRSLGSGEFFVKLFLAAFLIFFIGVFLVPLCHFGLILPGPYVLYTFMIGSVIQAMLLAFAKGWRINYLREQNDRVQAALMKQADDHALFLQSANQRLEEAVTQRTAALTQTLRDKELLLRELHHRVKNNLALIDSLLGLQIRGNRILPETAEALGDVSNRIHSISLVHELLYIDNDLERIDMKNYLEQLARQVFFCYSDPSRELELHIAVPNIHFPIGPAISCGLIVNELVNNALKHAFNGRSSGVVSVSLHGSGSDFELKVADDGCGIEALQQVHLGRRLVQMLTEQLGGETRIANEHGFAHAIRFSLED